jgi:outer membrane receptor protein involved in Fe transport
MSIRDHSANSFLWRALVFASALLLASYALAQDQAAGEDDEAKELDAVVVTGSRIKKTEIEGASPVFVMTAEQIEMEGHATVFDALNSMTQVTGWSQPEAVTNQFTAAAPQLSLRGLGPGRTLILLNGRRVADYPFPYNGESNFVNLQQIPVAAVERIEILSGGASAIYGSDAVAGVINVITKTRFDGNLLTARIGTTTEGGDSYRFQFVGGWEGERWSAVVAMEYHDRDPIFGKDRDYLDEYTDFPSAVQANTRSLLYIGDSFGFDFRGDGYTYQDPGEAACEPFVDLAYSFRGPSSGYYCGRDATGDESIRNQRTEATFYGNFQWEVTDNMQLFAQLLYSDGEIESSGFRRWWGSPFPFWNPGDDTVDATLGEIFIGIPAAGGYLQRVFQPVETGNQSNTFEEDSLDVTVGLRGNFGDSLWEWEASYNHSEYNSFNSQFYFKEELVDEYFLGTYVPELSAFGIPWFDVPDDWRDRFYTPMDPATVAELSGKSSDDSDASVDTLQFIFTGDLFEMPAGSVGFAGVLEWSTQEYQLRPDDRLLDQTGNGWWGRSATGGGGERDRYAAGAEINVPLFPSLTLPLAVRYDKYDDDSDVDDAWTWKAGIEFRPTDNLLLRGSMGTSFRAPDMHYLFAGDSGFFTTVTDYYLCRRDEPGVSFPDCERSNDQIAGSRRGNIFLEEEEGESWTVGFVWEVVDNLSISADLYNIKLEGIVQDQSIDALLQDEADCRLGVTVGGQPIDGNSVECQRIYERIQRNDFPGAPNDEFLSSVVTGPINRALQEQTGVDATLTYSILTERAGMWRFDGTYTHVLESKIQEFPEDPIQENWRDDPGNFDFRHRFRGSAAWEMGDWTTVLSAFNLGGVPRWDETGRVDDMWTYNLTVAWDVTDSIRLSVLGSNIFDEKPPLDDSWPGYPGFSFYNYNPVGREVWAQIDWAFGRR